MSDMNLVCVILKFASVSDVKVFPIIVLSDHSLSWSYVYLVY